jgi:hypothetical protein
LQVGSPEFKFQHHPPPKLLQTSALHEIEGTKIKLEHGNEMGLTENGLIRRRKLIMLLVVAGVVLVATIEMMEEWQ